jgi:allantoate deiminase
MCRAIAGFTETSGGITRTFLSEAMRECHRYLRQKMESLQLQTRVDAAGNLRGLYPGTRVDAARLVIGSHLDTVPNAGAFDGVLGVVLGLALLKALDGRRLPFEIEVIGFSEEEGVRFKVPFIGSRAFTGTLDDTLMKREDAAGISVASAIDHFGLDRSLLANAVFSPRTRAYLEFHIEQGPVLASIGQPLAIVDSICGQSRATVVFEGQANHAGTTPMRFRRDALTAAAEWITAVEANARNIEGLVATVGKLDIASAATNIVPGTVTASLDVRHSKDDTRQAGLANLLRIGEQVAATRGVRFSHSVQSDQNTVPMNRALVELAAKSLRACGIPPSPMTSGAGHDAMIVAPFIPSVMVFLGSPNGISHHPDETVLPGDVALALHSGLHFLDLLGSTLPYE